MAIGFRAVGTRTKADVGVSGSPLSFAMPTGHVSTDWLIWIILTDDNTGPVSTPSGWSSLGTYNSGTSTSSPYAGRPHVWMFHRVDNGTLGSTQSCSFSTSSWPGGNPYVLGFIAAYTGVDNTTPVETTQGTTTQSTNTALAHPTLNTSVANDWLLSVRGIVSDNIGLTCTDSVGTDVSRVSEGMTQPSSPSVALFDSNTALAAGLQTQRTTTSSNTCTYGSVGVSIAIRPAGSSTAVVAQAGVAQVSLSAKAPKTASANGPWALCTSGGPVYSFAIDWNGDGMYTTSSAMLMLVLDGTGGVDDATVDTISDVTFTYGRDQIRQLSPGAVGSASLTLANASRKYSPENINSPLYGNLDPARNARFQVTWANQVYPLFKGKIDDFDIRADFSNRTVSFTFLDNLALLQNTKLSTPLYQTLRTGDAINIVLDAIGWTAPRDIDHGATVVPFWWVEGTDAFTAIQDLVRSEGPPAVAYQAPDGTFVFRDRHHRLMRFTSRSSQAMFVQPLMEGCAPPAAPGFVFTEPFVYSNGWKDIVNSVAFDVDVRQPDLGLSAVWSSTDTISLVNGESRTINVSGSDPFMNAVTPVVGTDFTLAGAGTLTVQLSRTSGVSATISLTAVGGAVQVLSMQLRAQAVRVINTVKVTAQDATSIGQHGEKDYPDSAPWAGVNDAGALASLILTHYAQRLPTVQIRIPSADPSHWQQIVTRAISDRITIQNDELGMNADFYVESVTHTIRRVWTDRPPVHEVVLGCEKVPFAVPNNPLTFDKRGAGFDQGFFDPVASDDPSTIWIWDDPVQGTFDGGLFAT